MLDVLIVGGGAAGLSAGMMLGRSRRSVLIVDSGAPRNAPAAAVHALFTRDGTPPEQLLEIGRAEVERYGGRIQAGRVTDVTLDGGVIATLADGERIHARRLLVATGLVDRLPDIPGIAERWGRDVVHCPYCHGWEVRDQPIGVLATSPLAHHQVGLFRQLSDDVVLFANGVPMDPDRLEECAALGVPVVEGRVSALRIENNRITGVCLADGRVIPRSAIAVATIAEARADFLEGVGLHAVSHPMGGSYLPSEFPGRTSVPGIWVAGNATDISAQVGAAAAAGALAGAAINADLVAEGIRAAVTTRREAESAQS